RARPDRRAVGKRPDLRISARHLSRPQRQLVRGPDGRRSRRQVPARAGRAMTAGLPFALMLKNFVLLAVWPLLSPLVFAESSGQPWTLKPGKPEQAGMSAAQLARVAALLDEETRSGRVLAASVLVARRGIIVLHGAWGKISPEPGSRPAQPDTVYLVASITKPVTATALMLLVERGLVSLSDP